MNYIILRSLQLLAIFLTTPAFILPVISHAEDWALPTLEKNFTNAGPAKVPEKVQTPPETIAPLPAECAIPAISQDAQISYYTSKGGAYPTVKFSGISPSASLSARATKLFIRNDTKPVYLFLSSDTPMIWALQGNLGKVQHVVISGTALNGKILAAVNNIPRDKVSFLSKDICLPYFETQNDDYHAARKKLTQLARKKPDIQVPANKAASIENFDDHFKLNEFDVPEGQISTGIISVLRQIFVSNIPGGIVSVDPSKLTSDIPLQNLEAFPGSAGLAQLIYQGAIVPMPKSALISVQTHSPSESVVNIPTNYRIIKPIAALPPLNTDDISPDFLLAPGVAAPALNPGYCIISEETGKGIDGSICSQLRYGGASLAKPAISPPTPKASDYDAVPSAAGEFLNGLRQNNISERVKKRFKSIDKDHDGVFTEKDFKPGYMPGAGEAAFLESRTIERFMPFDIDKNKQVTPEEIQSSLEKYFPSIDLDHDGLINTVEARQVFDAFYQRNKPAPCRPGKPSPEAQFVFIDSISGEYNSSVSLQNSYPTSAARIIVAQDSKKPVYIMIKNNLPTLWSIEDPGKRIEKVVINAPIDFKGTKKIAAGITGVNADKVIFQAQPLCFHDATVQNTQIIAEQEKTIQSMVDRKPDNHLFMADGGTFTIEANITTEIVEPRDIVGVSLSDVVTPTKATIQKNTHPSRAMSQARMQEHGGHLLGNSGTIAILTPTPQKRPAPAQSNKRILAPNPLDCVFKKPAIPAKMKVLAYGVYKGNEQGVRSHDAPTYIDLKVDGAAGENVALILGSHEANIWNVKAQNVNIVAVFLAGYGLQDISGIQENVPILGYFRREAEGNACTKSLDFDNITWLNPFSERYFGKSVDFLRLEYAPNQEINRKKKKDEPVEETVTLDTRTSVSAFNPQTSSYSYEDQSPQTLPPPFQALIEQGIIRPATTQDIKNWSTHVRSLNAAYRNVPPVDGHPEKELLVGMPYGLTDSYRHIFVIQKAMTFSEEMVMPHYDTFFLPADVPFPEGDFERASVFSFKDGTCTGFCYEWGQ